MQTFIKLCEQFVAVRRHQWKKKTRHLPSGWRKLGDGHFGEAWAHKDHTGLVLKISGRAGWANEDRDLLETEFRRCGAYRLDAWPVFARHCQMHPSKHLPRIYHLVSVSVGITWAVMPYYEPAWPVHATIRDRWADNLYGEGSAPEWLWPIIQMADSMRLTVDLHEGNVLYDPANDALILTDPFSFTDE